MANQVSRRPTGCAFPEIKKLEEHFTTLAKKYRGYEDWMGRTLFADPLWQRIINGGYFLLERKKACGQWVVNVDPSTTRGKRFFDHESESPIVLKVTFNVKIIDYDYHNSWYDKERTVEFKISREHEPADCNVCTNIEEDDMGVTSGELQDCESLVNELSTVLILQKQGRHYTDEERERVSQIGSTLLQHMEKRRAVACCVNCGQKPLYNIRCGDCGESLCEDCAGSRYDYVDCVGSYPKKRKSVKVRYCKLYCKKKVCFHCGEPRKNLKGRWMRCEECGVDLCKKCSTITFNKNSYHSEDCDTRYEYKCIEKCDLCEKCGKRHDGRDDERCMCNSCYRCSGRIGELHPRSSGEKYPCYCMRKYGLQPGRDPKDVDRREVTWTQISHDQGKQNMINCLAAGGTIYDMNSGTAYRGPQPS